MTSADLIALLRRRIGEVDTTAAYTDGQVMTAFGDARRVLAVKQVPGMSEYTVDPDDESPTFGISPEPSDEHALLLVLRSALDLLRDRYIGMLRRGEFGVIWRSGLESESSVEASQKYNAMLVALERELHEHLLIEARTRFLARVELL